MSEVSETTTGVDGDKPGSPLHTNGPPKFSQELFKNRVSNFFYGPDGLRPVWQLLLFILLWRAFYFLAGVFFFFLPRGAGRLWLQLFAEAGMAASAAIPTLILAGFEQRSFGSYGLPRRGAFGKLFWSGMLWGFGSLTVLMLALHAAGVFDLGAINLHGTRILKFAAFWGTFFLLVGFYEEILARGYAQVVLTAGIGFWPAAFTLSAAFASLHLSNPGETPAGLASVFLIALFFCLTLRRTGTLWFAVGFHAAWDWGESFFYSVPDSGLTMPGHLMNSSLHGPSWLSGGTVGPEGSVFAFAVTALTAVAFAFVYRAARFPSDVEAGLVPPVTSPPQAPYQE